MQSPISLVDRTITRAAGVIDGSEIDWERYMAPGDAAKIVPAEQVSKAGRRAMLLEDAREEGFPLPWGAHMSKGLIRPSALHLWTGWTHHGKSQMAKMFMLQAIRHGQRVLIASLEETLVRIWRDMAHMFCGTGKPTAATLDSFTVVSAAQVDLANVATVNNLSVTGTNIDLNGSSYTSSAGAIAFTGVVDLDSIGALAVSSGGGAGDNVTFTGAGNDASDTQLSLTAGLGAVTLTGSAICSTLLRTRSRSSL